MHINTPPATQVLDELALDIPSHLYKGAGRCWVAIKDGQIVAVQMMDDHKPLEGFATFRLRVKAELNQLGDVWSGMASGMQFYAKEAELLARAINVAAAGDSQGLELK